MSLHVLWFFPLRERAWVRGYVPKEEHLRGLYNMLYNTLPRHVTHPPCDNHVTHLCDHVTTLDM